VVGVECDQNRIRSRWFQHGNVEYQVYSMETVRKSIVYGMGAGMCKDFVWSKEFLCEFLGAVVLYGRIEP